MAVSAATKMSDFSGFIPREQSAPIFDKAAEMSVVQRLAQQVPLSFAGTSTPVITGDVTASWVSEGAIKGASTATMGLKNMDPKKLAVLIPVSAEVVRANPANFLTVVRNSAAKAFAAAFDAAAFHGTSTPFAAYLDQTTKAIELGAHTASEGGVWADLVPALDLLVTAGKELNGWALDNVMEPNLLGSVDSTGRPIFVDTPLTDTAAGAARPGRLMGRLSYMGKSVATTNKTTVVGYAGDWSQVAWGTVGGISYDVSTEASVTINGSLVSAFENNLVIVRAEAEYGFVVNDVDAFVRITNLTGS
jgi:HK97 family phage major capsid protein